SGRRSYATTGRLTNHGQLLAGRVLTVSGRDVENTASGVMRGDTTVVKATSTLTNHCLIDGRDTRIDAGALVNGPTGRIYGDRLSIAAGSVLNDTAADGGSAGTIAAREVLDIGVGSIVNRKGALVLSGGDLRIGGALDAERHATGSAAVLRNQAATIEALGNMTVHVATLENQAGGVSWTMKQAQTQALEFSVTPGGQRFKADEVFIGLLQYQNGIVSGWTAKLGSAADLTDDDDHALLLVPSSEYPLAKFKAYYLQSPASSRDTEFNPCTGETTGICTIERTPGAWYAPSDPIWAAFGVTPPARDLPADHPYRLDPDVKVGQDGIYVMDGFGPPTRVRAFDHPVTQADIDEGKAYFQAHEDLDAATDRFIAFNGGRAMLGADIIQSRFAVDYYIWQYTATTQTPVLDKTSDPARIVAGGAMTLTVGGGTNDMGQILAGGELSVLGGAIKDTSMEVQATGEGHGTVQYSHIGKRGGAFGSRIRVYDPNAYDEVIPPKTILLGVARQEGHTAVASSQTPASTAYGSVDPAVGSAGGVSSGGRTAAIIEVPVSVQASSGGTGGAPGAGVATGVDVAANAAPAAQAAARADTAGATAAAMPTRTSSGASTPQPLVVRTTTPDATIPKASLFKTAPGPSAHHLVETDPAFADYRTWLSSDYLLNALGHDPTLVTKRLGDGFYEQRLIREQVAQLTGYRFLEGLQDDTTEYQALMDAGRTFAQR
ncbi:MAG TPA: hypothetical protein VMR43_14320, partial [Variovorax sp.]|nr:hypothetical protein [Variovorax sp.]